MDTLVWSQPLTQRLAYWAPGSLTARPWTLNFLGPKNESLQTPYHPCMAYLPTFSFTIKKSTKCRQIYHTRMVWELSFLSGEMLKVGGCIALSWILARHRHPPTHQDDIACLGSGIPQKKHTFICHERGRTQEILLMEEILLTSWGW